MKFNNQYKVVVFGGRNEHDLYGTETLDCIEIFDEEIEEWKKTELKMNCPRESFSFVTVFSNSELIAGMNDGSQVSTNGLPHSQQNWLIWLIPYILVLWVCFYITLLGLMYRLASSDEEDFNQLDALDDITQCENLTKSWWKKPYKM